MGAAAMWVQALHAFGSLAAADRTRNMGRRPCPLPPALLPPLPPCRRDRVAELLERAKLPEGFRFSNPEGFDLGAKLRQSEPHKTLLGGPLPSRRMQPPAPPPMQRPPAPGVLAEQPCNALSPQRRSGFQVPAKPSGGADGSRWQAAPPQQPPQQPYPPQQHAAQPGPQPAPAHDSRWAAKVPRRAQDAHVHSGRHSSGDEGFGGHDSGSGDEGDEGEAGKRSIPGFQTAKTKLIAEMRQRGQQYNGGQLGGGGGGAPAPRQGLARPPGLRKTGVWARCWSLGQGSMVAASCTRRC